MNEITDPNLKDKLNRLNGMLAALESAVVAYSGGVDSTLLACAAHHVLGSRVLLVTAASESYPEWERAEATKLARERDWPHEIVQTSELGIPGFSENPPDRCYFCKRELFSTLRQIADERGLAAVVDGTTVDDLTDHRPGRRAAKELGVVSPLLDAGLSKDNVRVLSARWNLPTASKSAFACLASRFPTGTTITHEKLQVVEKAEDALRGMGFWQYRVRHHGEIARIEVGRPDVLRLLQDGVVDQVLQQFKALGFLYVTVDLEGYRQGSTNAVAGNKA